MFQALNPLTCATVCSVVYGVYFAQHLVDSRASPPGFAYLELSAADTFFIGPWHAFICHLDQSADSQANGNPLDLLVNG
ncbi:hypothetical protein P170DRAFT_439011 [Aspergillus steynii IBT 23096]|uniref:Uncharacterized protein n=1 Tax=Aspergillus steynii IBT 23096 TaxID=1392250 RepID=A0A2I2G364_9EURO|nr:uncharacterized protein P170DRAFT_439011 [Aspergillus steynii IBT 23096]PLB47323.1 hypothetical protein P170DRAFT_439011 [Aspergillus steynii IBT 23096]